MKDELEGKIRAEFGTLRPNTYSYLIILLVIIIKKAKRTENL